MKLKKNQQLLKHANPFLVYEVQDLSSPVIIWSLNKTASEWLGNDKIACSFREIHFAVNIGVQNKKKK